MTCISTPFIQHTHRERQAQCQ